MVDPLSFVAKIIGVTARVGAVVALAAGAVYLARRAGIEFFVTLDQTTFVAIILAGLIGASAVAVELIIAIGKGIKWVGSWAARRLSASAERRTEKRTALDNMKVLTPEFAMVLRFLKSQNLKRFPAPGQNDLLYRMERAFLLKIDDPNWSAYAIQTYYAVPNYVWHTIDVYLDGMPVPPHPPWITPPDPTRWMRG